jgi:hypothetical protein
MLLDETLVFSEEQKITAEAPSTNVVDQGAAGDAYNALWVVVNVKEDFAGADYLDVDVETAEDASFSDAKVLASVQAPAAALKAGENIVALRLPAGCDRFIRLNYVPTGSPSTGKVKAFLTDMAPIGHK